MLGGPLCALHVGDADLPSLVEDHLQRERSGATVDGVADAEAALDALESDDYDCVVSGYELPGRDGLELLAAVRERYPDLPFVLFTDAGSEAVASEAVAAGVTDYVRKGGTDQLRVLARRVDEAVGARRPETDPGESERRLRTLIANLPGMVYRAQPEDPWYIEFVGGETDFTGYDAEAFESGAVTFGDDLIHPEDREDVQKAIADALDDDRSFETTYRIRTADGETRHVHEQGQAVPDGESVALEGFIMDITDRREQERRLRRQNGRLDEFAETVSHDLRNPLNVAVGRLSMVETDDPNVEKAERALERMDLLIDDLLDLAREGRTVENPTSVDLAPLVRRCWHGVSAAGATLRVRTDRTVEAEREQLRRLVENLLRNAVEHSVTTGDGVERADRPTGSSDAEGDESSAPGVEIVVGDLDEGGFYVADDGPGIPADERERVFERGHTTHSEGTGFGLTIVERIAEAHGWDVTVTDSEAGGARFEFRTA